MITVNIYQKENKICAFEISGHAGYAPAGADIVCAAVSILALNTLNAVERFTDTAFRVQADEKTGGYLKAVFPIEGMEDERVQLLLQTLLLGLSEMQEEYNQYLTLTIEEV
ncbi:MAG TPA: ribosomal-processing cysteine protease Prp [Candidatus Anaerotignum merdipullorum]|nr:ribosomal-processing cysteine protease Prp [Candidatus Anaerotignum merdipullorum]